MASQVRVMRSGHEPFVAVRITTRLTFVPAQPSATLGGSKFHGVPHSTFLSPAQTSVGGVVSTTVTLWLHERTVPHWSVACQVRVRVLGQLPLVSVRRTVIVTPPQPLK